MGGFSFWHILIFAIILLLLFGGNRFSAMMGDVAKGLKSFKQGMSEDDKPEERRDPRSLPRSSEPDRRDARAAPHDRLRAPGRRRPDQRLNCSHRRPADVRRRYQRAYPCRGRWR